tara:strand:+ start:1590 stop:4178 length:2589 start_codon:yes stop_codon:yes gene_type:complete
MARYDRYGKQDDRIAEEFDTGFIGFNNRLRPDQLPTGVLTESNNGRLGLNGEWQTRKTIDFLASPFQPAPLKVGSVRLHNNAWPSISGTPSISSGTVTISFGSDAFPYAGQAAASWVGKVVNLTGFAGNVPIDGNYLIASAPANNRITVVITGLTSISTVGTARGPHLDDTAINEIEDAIEYSDPNNNSESYVLCVGTNKASVVKTSDSSTVDIIYPSGLNAVGGQALQAFNKVFIFRDGKIALEWDGVLTGTPDFTRVANGSFTEPSDIIVPAGSFQVVNQIGTVVSETGSLSQGTSIFIKNGVNSNITDPDDAEYDISGSGLRQVVPKDGGGFHFEFFVKEVFVTDSSPTAISTTSLSTTSGTGSFTGYNKATFTTSAGHELKVGDPISIANYHSSVNGNRVVAEVGSTTTFSIYISGTLSSQSASGSPTVGLKKGFTFSVPAECTDGIKTSKDTLIATPTFLEKASEGSGFTHMPAPPFGEYHQRRIVVPFRYSMDENASGTTITDRNIHDELLFSQFLLSDEYDIIFGQFRLNAGTSDFIVGIHSFSEDKLVVFNRGSIHLISNSFIVEDARSTLVTNEVGCLARKSIVQVSNNLIFLSDNGIYGVDFQDLYNLRGRDLPLSATIEATIQNINKDYAENAVAVYFDNRYFIALPIGPNAKTNNTLLIYNFINKGWESIDSINNPAWEFTHLTIAGKGQDRGVYATNRTGGVHKIEGGTGGNDVYTIQVGSASQSNAVVSSATTRMYTLKSIDRKKWNNFDLHIESEVGLESNGNLFIETENLDSKVEGEDSRINLGTLASFNNGTQLTAGEDYSIRGRIGNRRAYGLQFTLDTTFGRPKFRSLKVAGAQTFRNTSTAE